MTLITRAQWGARPPKSTGNAIGAHPKGVAIHYEGPKIGTRPHTACAAMVRSIQTFHMDTRGWADVAYNFMACEHGYLFEGRGTGKGSAANGTTQANLDYYAVVGLVGVGDPTPAALKDGIRDGIDLCRAAGAGSALVGHRDLFATACPGVELYAWVKAGCPRSTPPRTVTTPSRSVVRTTIVTPGTLHVTGMFDGPTIGRLSQWAGVTPAPTTSRTMWRAVQRKVGGWSLLGLPNATMWRGLQRTVGATPDGVPGPGTFTALQKYLNAH